MIAATELQYDANDLSGIIALKLKKPKSWNWQLSTSKSSPNIVVPIIKLYDFKGNLLLETKDSGSSCNRRSWHSDDIKSKSRQSINESKPKTLNLERNCCEEGDVFTPNKQDESIRRTEVRRSDKNNNHFTKTSVGEKINVTDEQADAPLLPSKKENAGQEEKRDKFTERMSENVGNYSKKSSSDSQTNRGFNPIHPIHRRTKSDDAFRRKLKYSDTFKLDGFKDIPSFGDDAIQKRSSHTDISQRSCYSISQPESKTAKRDFQTLSERTNDNRSESNQPRIHPKYKSRTSSAGTLIMSEESFYKPSRSRRRQGRESSSTIVTSAQTSEKCAESNSTLSTTKTERVIEDHQALKNIGDNRSISSPETPSIPYRISFPSTEDDMSSIKTVVSHLRQRSDPIQQKAGWMSFRKSPYLSEEARIAEEKSHSTCSEQANNRSRSTSSLREGGDAGIELYKQHRKKKSRKISGRRRQERLDDGSTTSSDATSEDGRQMRYQDKKTSSAFIKPKQPLVTNRIGSEFYDRQLREDRNNNAVSPAVDFLDLVRHLSTNADRDVTTRMGANVSRHSSKGLSGRRSQSSGSICNGKGRHGEGKSCGSLPSYLDDGEGRCNNNHDSEKSNPEEDPRIPPLGDGAPLHWKFSDTQTALCDQGYGSERSPEEEYPPPLPEHDNQCHHHEHHHLEPHACYPFITPESTFLVRLSKGSRGLGLSVTGGVDSGGSWPGLIRIKRLFPHQPASQCGLINVGDLLLEANGIALTGLTNYEALEVLRTASNQVELKICRPPPDVLTCVSPVSEVPPPPPRREGGQSGLGTDTPPPVFSSPEDDYYHGEFEIVINKIQGSLGFTLRKEDDSALGHYVRALVREPALTDGRIKAGDKIIAVNDVEISPMSHEQAVQFLRQCGEEVKLRLYRDAAQTPVAALSPTETTPRTSFSRKSNLRQEAVDMLNDIAVRKLIPGHDDGRGPDQGRTNDSFGQGPASMPHIPLENPTAPSGFSYKNPAYQTAHPPCLVENDESPPPPAPQSKPLANRTQQIEDDSNIRKWKGAVLDEAQEPVKQQKTADLIKMREENEILAIELNRGWNSRLGFSLQGAAGVTYVSAVYNNSVAARDGRLKPGDRLIRVNDESVEHMSTTEIIDLLRIVRGPVCIVVSRTNSREDCIKSNAVN